MHIMNIKKEAMDGVLEITHIQVGFQTFVT
jgi:hypothetical protein